MLGAAQPLQDDSACLGTFQKSYESSWRHGKLIYIYICIIYMIVLAVKAANEMCLLCCGCEPVICQERLRSLISQHQVMLFMKGNPDAPRCGFSRVSSSHMQNS